MKRARVHHAARRRGRRGRSRRARSSRRCRWSGFSTSARLTRSQNVCAAFRQGLKESGYVEGENVAIVYRLAENQYDRLPELAADLVRRQVAVIATAGDDAALVAKAATTTIPIVFLASQDPVKLGLVAQPRPAGRQRDRHQFFDGRAGGKAAGNPA